MASLRQAIVRPARRLLKRGGYDLVKRADPSAPKPPRPIPVDFDAVMVDIVERVRPFTMTTPDRIGGLVLAVRYIVDAGIPGAIVECGCWRGGSVMTAALTLQSLGCDDREIYGFDSFGLMPEPTDRDVTASGRSAQALFEGPNSAHLIPEMNNVPMEEVVRNIQSTGYPADRIKIVKGFVEDTVPAQAPPAIALLRLDTDWYESTAHEMEQLFPRITNRGVLIVDDYGVFLGAKDAVDEYLAAHGTKLLLTRMDHAGRMAVIHR